MADAPEGTDSQTPVTEPPPPPPPQSGPPAKADLGKRAIAMIIDAVIVMIVGFIPVAGGIVATAYWLVRDGLDLEFMDHRSIGKKLVKLRPVTLDGKPLDIQMSIKRNWMFALGGVAQLFAMTIIGLVVALPLGLIAFVIGIVEVVLVVTDAESRRMGDKMAGTRVIETDS
jgi:uncharacterized RDD family membrane protein YckC